MNEWQLKNACELSHVASQDTWTSIWSQNQAIIGHRETMVILYVTTWRPGREQV
jgi:hypothetical protein